MDDGSEQFFLLYGNDDISVDFYGISGKKEGILAADAVQHRCFIFVCGICESLFSGNYQMVQLVMVFHRLCGGDIALLFVL